MYAGGQYNYCIHAFYTYMEKTLKIFLFHVDVCLFPHPVTESYHFFL